MHELSIAMSLVELACDEARRVEDTTVRAVHIRLGALAGIVRQPLVFSFDVAKQGTPISTARLEIEDVPVTVWCPRCGAERELLNIQSRRCPMCDTPTPRILRGEELELFAIEIDDDSSDR
jgi:hydrogenase nickel incorporation protein HypA/HybF